MKRTLLAEMVAIHGAQENCRKSGNGEWLDKHSDHLERLADNLPSGSGIDSGTKVLLLSPTKAIFQADYHHMNDAGYYDGWSKHTVTVTPTFLGLNIKISGRDRNQIKDYLHDCFSVLEEEVTEDGRLVSLVKAQEAYQIGIANGTI